MSARRFWPSALTTLAFGLGLVGSPASVTFLAPSNNQHTVTVHAEPMRIFVRALKPGGQVDVDYVAELAVSIEPATR